MAALRELRALWHVLPRGETGAFVAEITGACRTVATPVAASNVAATANQQRSSSGVPVLAASMSRCEARGS